MSGNLLPNFSRPLSPRPTPPAPPTRPPPPPPMSGFVSDTGARLNVVVGEEEEERIHSPESSAAEPASEPQALPYLRASLSTNSLVRRQRVTTMRPSRPLARSTTTPDLQPSTSAPTISEPREDIPDRDGAVSRVDRYSRIIPAAPPAPTVAGPSRPSGLRMVTFASDISDIPESDSANPSQSSSTPKPHQSDDSA